MTEPSVVALARNRATVMEELRRLIPRLEGPGTLRTPLPFGVAALDSHLPDGGLTCGALHEIVPATEGAIVAAFGFVSATLARLIPPSPRALPLVIVTPSFGLRPYRRHGRLHGHGLRAVGLDPARVILVETAHRKETLWAMEEAVRSQAPAAVLGVIDTLDLKLSQRLHLAATEAGLPLFLLRPASTLEGSAAATRWRVGNAHAARDRFGLFTRPRWHLQLERCRNGRPGQWVVEYDHVAHCFSLAAALADPAHARGAGEEPIRQAG
jgi:protein ImuA